VGIAVRVGVTVQLIGRRDAFWVEHSGERASAHFDHAVIADGTVGAIGAGDQLALEWGNGFIIPNLTLTKD
jgi:hypothetical protein